MPKYLQPNTTAIEAQTSSRTPMPLIIHAGQKPTPRDALAKAQPPNPPPPRRAPHALARAQLARRGRGRPGPRAGRPPPPVARLRDDDGAGQYLGPRRALDEPAGADLRRAEAA